MRQDNDYRALTIQQPEAARVHLQNNLPRDFIHRLINSLKFWVVKSEINILKWFDIILSPLLYKQIFQLFYSQYNEKLYIKINSISIS